MKEDEKIPYTSFEIDESNMKPKKITNEQLMEIRKKKMKKLKIIIITKKMKIMKIKVKKKRKEITKKEKIKQK